MRAFISLELPKAIKKEVGQIQIRLQKAGLRAKWVRPEISHLTLAFFNSLPPNKIEPIEKILEEATSQIKPIKLKLYQLGFFPSAKKAKIIHLSLLGEIGKTNALSVKTRKRLKKEKIGFDKKPFTAHITLGRLKKSQNLNLVANQVKIKKTFFVANKVCLNKSTLTSSGPVYEKLKCVFLKQTKQNYANPGNRN